MKRLISLFLAFALVLSVAPVIRAESTQRTGIRNEMMTTRGTVYPTGSYYCNKLLEEIPVTMEAWVYLPADTYASLGGTILGNKPNNDHPSFSFTIEENGVPQLAFDYVGGERRYNFTTAAVPQETWTHVAIVYGTGTDNKQVYCYIDGELKGSSATSKWYAAGADMLTRKVCLAGDQQQVNFEGFVGTLGDVTVYSDVRSATEIQADMAGTLNLDDPNLMMHYDLSNATEKTTIPDASGNGYHMQYEKMWLTQAERDAIMAEDTNVYTYTMAFIPDIQLSTRLWPSRLKPIFTYLAENAESMNIQYAIGLGDLTDNNTVVEWDLVKSQYDRLNGILPYSLIRGNHDITRNDYALLYDQYFSVPGEYYYDHIQSNGGFFDETTTANTYLTFCVGDVKYVLLNLDFGASDEVLAWADGVLTEYADHRAFIVTHGYLASNGERLTADDSGAPSRYEAAWNDADDMWNKLIRKHENVDLVACGHVGVDHILCTTDTGDNGNIVYQMLSDTQYVDRKILGAGIVTLMHFTEDGRFARVEHYSTVLEKYFRQSNYDVAMDFDKTSQPEIPEASQTMEAYCQHCNQTVTWQSFTSDFAADATQTSISGGHYYLSKDLTFSKKSISANNTVCLDLNGYTYTGSEHLVLEKNATLNIQGKDGAMRGCGSTAGDPGRTIYVKAGATLNLYSGTLSGLSSTLRSAGNGGVLGVYGTFNMYGGTVRDGISDGVGGSLFVDRAATFRMYGGQILPGTAPTAECAYTRGKTLIANDASISNLTISPKSGNTTTEDLLTIQGTYTGTLCMSFEKVTAAGTVMGISDNADISGAKIYFTNNDLLVKVVDDTLVSYLPDAAQILDGTSYVSYSTLEEALAALQDGQTLVLHQGSTQNITIPKNITLDVNGRKLTGTLAAAEGVTVYVKDSFTADYDISDGVYGKIKAISGNILPAEATATQDPYLLYQGSSYLSYHAIGLNISGMTLKPGEAALYFNNNFACDSLVRSQIASFGIAMSVEGAPTLETMENEKHYTKLDASLFGTEDGNNGSLLYGIMKDTNSTNTNLRNAQTTVYGTAYVQLTNGEYLFGTCKSRSLQEQVVACDQQFDSLGQTQKDGLAAMYAAYPNVLSTWNLTNVENYIGK